MVDQCVAVRQVYEMEGGEGFRIRVLDEVQRSTGQAGSVEWRKMCEGWSWARKQDTEEDHFAAAEGWVEIARRSATCAHDLYILDQFTYPLHGDWVDIDDVLAALANRPGHQHVVITGRHASTALLDAADLVVEMTKVKHPNRCGDGPTQRIGHGRVP